MINCYTPRKCPSVSLSMNTLAFLLHSNHFCHFWSKVPKFSLSFCSPCQIIQNGKVQQWEVCTSGPKGASFSFGSEKQNHHCTFMCFKPTSHAGNVDGNCVLVLVSSYEKIFGLEKRFVLPKTSKQAITYDSRRDEMFPDMS